MRIAFIADTHRTVDQLESHSLYPKRLAKMPPTMALETYERIRDEVERAYQSALTWLHNNGPWDILIGLGDLAGGWQERGCNHPSAIDIATKTVRDLRGISPSCFCLGNHETGYSTPSTMPGAGMTAESAAVCQNIFGDLWWRLEMSEMMILGLCSPLVQYKGPDHDLTRYKEEQADFIRDCLADWRAPWILCTHDPLVSWSMAGIIKSHTKRLRAMVYGDWHDPRKGQIARVVGYLSGASLFNFSRCLSRGIMAPSTAPLWWKGYKLLTVDIHSTGEIVPTYINLPKPPESERIPVSSFWRALWWMMQPYKHST